MFHSNLTVRRALALVAVPALLVTGCLGGGDDDAKAPAEKPSAEAEKSSEPKPEPVKFSELPDACKTVPGKTIEDIVPEAENEKGKNLKSKDTDSYTSCLWSGLDEYDYRSLFVSLRRYDSVLDVGSGDDRAARSAASEVEKITGDKANKKVEEKALKDLGDEATTIGFDSEEKGDDGGDYRNQRVVARTANVVVVVDYSGTGFEDADNPKADEIRKGAEKAAEQVVAAVK
ncbi:hypothetical protein GCM10023347_10260 [Streptomyces chumphonensis]|uniref:DUF3558 domain-containing protein n=1 Tax=Streptomyces chumphonensis TaxID=1214925 RepID=A0A927F2F6_9ACTN|nr:DUF3558 domain-containing protein [Streptomyces chumphonensis]MBD3933968.1 DUF3558 domain-containing protein [Streptomyces chumphonensis]